MSSDGNDVEQPVASKRPRDSEGLTLTKNKRLKAKESPHPLIAVGKHFARTIEAVTLPQVVLIEGAQLTALLKDDPDTELDTPEKRLLNAFQRLITYHPSIEEKLVKANGISKDELDAVQLEIRAVLQKGGSSARSDDMRGIKINIVEWIRMKPDEELTPALLPKQKTGRGFNHPRTGFLLCPANMNWEDPKVQDGLKSGEIDPYEDTPMFMYEGYKYYPLEPWKGFFKSSILVKAYKHVFTTPSSAEEGFSKNRATRPGNARLRGMTAVTPASLAYIAMMVRFALTDQQTFNRNDMVTYTERFYTDVLDHLEDPDETEELESLLLWWNTRVFPAHVKIAGASSGKNTVLAAIKKARAALRALTNTNSEANGHVSEDGVVNEGAEQPAGGSGQSTAVPQVTT